MLRAIDQSAEYAGYFDADLATPLESSAEFIETLDRNPELHLVSVRGFRYWAAR